VSEDIYKKLFDRALEIGKKKVSLLQALLSCVTASANECYIFQQCAYILYLFSRALETRELF
jgi:hypothetical protein